MGFDTPGLTTGTDRMEKDMTRVVHYEVEVHFDQDGWSASTVFPLSNRFRSVEEAEARVAQELRYQHDLHCDNNPRDDGKNYRIIRVTTIREEV
jgi:hypothetical protein